MRMSQEELDMILKNSSVRIHGDPRAQEPKKKAQKTTRGKSKNEFQSLAESRYYEDYIRPMELAGLLENWSMHESFVVLDPIEYQGIRFGKKIYSPDFVLHFKNGVTKVIEVKGSKIKKLQREYPLKKQLFIQRYCIPNHWDFVEIKAEDLTGS